MQNAFEPLFNICQGQLEVSRRCMDAMFSGTEKIDQVMIGATYRALNAQLDLAKDLMSVSDPQSAGSALQARFLSPPNNALNDQGEIMRIVAEVQTNIGNSLRDYMDSLGRSAPRPDGYRPAGEAMPFNPVSSMFTIWESAFKDAATMAKRNMTTARSTMEAATGKAQRAGQQIYQEAEEAAEAATGKRK